MKYLKSVREDRGMTQKQMAEVLDISYGYYKQVENNFRQPSFQLLITIKTEFPDVDMNQIFTEKEKG